ncbi:hypothetical protein F0562_012790 [Nyssa sinensis]|uniref:Uncharacterized protein n=1 Tax=Nyssa sinensis TaxID=561372 RepID=A0A5J4ZVU4_9ASTE|nr:hypothetical protein F0562_012790 [Nyssa sinensis]
MAVHRFTFLMTSVPLLILMLILILPLQAIGSGRAGWLNRWDSMIRMPVDDIEPEENGTRWAVLVAGSLGYGNYRHQADVCHAYQILKRGGLKEENIVVFMYDDIAAHQFNPRPGVIINHPKGRDVYAGVPKDYTGEHVTVENLYAVLLGDRKAVKGGSGKVVDSKPNDRVFVYYSDHGGPGVLEPPPIPCSASLNSDPPTTDHLVFSGQHLNTTLQPIKQILPKFLPTMGEETSQKNSSSIVSVINPVVTVQNDSSTMPFGFKLNGSTYSIWSQMMELLHVTEQGKLGYLTGKTPQVDESDSGFMKSGIHRMQLSKNGC